MARKCSFSECDYPVFGTDKNTGKGYCKSHQWNRTDTSKRISKSSVERRNYKLSRNKYEFNPLKWGFSSEISIFWHLWIIKPHKSEVSGKKLTTCQWMLCYFAHVLSKNKYPLYRYNPDNFMLVTEKEHHLIDQGNAEQRKKYENENPGADFSVFFNKKKLLLKEYNLITKNK